MKFVTLGLAILLAVGCRAASMQADAPAQAALVEAPPLLTYVNTARSTVKTGLEMLRTIINEMLTRFEGVDSENADWAKTMVNGTIEGIFTRQESASKITDGIVETFDDLIKPARDIVHQDITELKAMNQPNVEKIFEMIGKWCEKLKTDVDNFKNIHKEEINTLKGHIYTFLGEVQTMSIADMKEMKPFLDNMWESYTKKGFERLGQLKVEITPYMQELFEQAKVAYSQVKSGGYEGVSEKLREPLEDVKASITKLVLAAKSLIEEQ